MSSYLETFAQRRDEPTKLDTKVTFRQDIREGTGYVRNANGIRHWRDLSVAQRYVLLIYHQPFGVRVTSFCA